jgi:hypothetical protein
VRICLEEGCERPVQLVGAPYSRFDLSKLRASVLWQEARHAAHAAHGGEGEGEEEEEDDDDAPSFPAGQSEEERKGTAAAQGSCAHARCVHVDSRAHDGNHMWLPAPPGCSDAFGGEHISGYLMRGFYDSDGMHADICVECGHVNLGFDLAVVKQKVAALERGDSSDNSDDDLSFATTS